MRIHLLFILMVYFVFTCKGQNVDNAKGTNWLNIDYIKDMKNKLPCECADRINYIYYISVVPESINTADNVKVPQGKLNYVIQTEPVPFYILSEESKTYSISVNSVDKAFELTLNGDTLLLSDSIYVRKFVKTAIPFVFFENYPSLELDNINLLNESLLSRSYPTIQTILKEDLLGFECNAWLGNINLIVSYKTGDLWILEIKNKYLFIHKVLNPQRDPLAPLKTKVIDKLQWIIK